MYPDVVTLVVSLIFFLRIMLSSLTSPINEISKEITSKRIGILNNLFYNFVLLILLRVSLLILLNIVIALVFLMSIDLLLHQSFEIIPYHYITVLFTCFIGSFSLVGLGFLISGLMIFTKIKYSFLVIIQIIVFYSVFAYPKGHILIPFSNAKLLIYNIIAGASINKEHLLNSLFSCTVNSIIFILIGIIMYRFLYLLTIKKKSLISLNEIKQ